MNTFLPEHTEIWILCQSSIHSLLSLELFCLSATLLLWNLGFLFHCVFFQERECKLTQEILELIDREVDLMSREVKECNLEGLRKRICTLFLQYVKTPKFNPEVAKILKVLFLFYSLTQ